MFKLWALLLCLGAATVVPAAQRFKFLVPTIDLKPVRLGYSIIIDCETTDPSAVVTLWKFNRGKEVQIQPSLNVIQSGQIFNMNNIALEDAGKYKCNAEDTLGTKITKDVVVIINNYKPALVLRPSTPVVTLTGQTVSFTCEAVVGTIMWRHISDNMQSNPRPSKYTVKKVSASRSVLTIPNAQVSNSGVYECWLYYHTTALYRNVHLTVRDPEKPSFANGNSQTEIKTVKLGHSLHLNCKATGFPAPVISWEKNNNPITLCRKHFLDSCSTSDYLFQPRGMKIKSARFPENNGIYTCVARSSAGTSRKNFQVVVEVKPVLEKSTSLLWHSRNVRCHATTGNPPPTFEWSMQLLWNRMENKPKRKWKPIGNYRVKAKVSRDGMSSKLLSIPSIIRWAFFKCVARNAAGNDTHVIKMF